MHQPLHLISIAGTAECKGIRFLFVAIKMLPLNLQNKLKITILGQLLSDEQLQKLGYDNSISSIVNFVGFTNHPKKYLLDADVGFVLSYREETISFACREMMSCGLPVIVSNFGGLPNNIDHGINGWITNKEDPVSIFNTLMEILSASHETIMLCKHEARKKAVTQFDLKIMLEKTYKLYQNIYSS